LLEAAAREHAIVSAHDVSDGGLAITLAECCTASEDFSAEARIEAAEPAEHAYFGERGARAVVSCDAQRVARVRALASQYGVRAEEIGRVGRGAFRLGCGETIVVNAAIETVREGWGGALKHLLESETGGA
jgi:phosphoribosylformylglycinamidine synthase